ncbi:MAG: hypothetical protein PHW15_00465 [Patescibacteria group bacterium]|jgi:predicted PurR-regulated permease PerM|nr:hypothetical protein [Patescibacteria group bacterium]MDD5172875.1 hypothetical protein [Patescibacteria group bacterium]
MTSQNFFYITSSSAIIIVAFLFVVLIVIGIVVAARIAKTFRNISQVSKELSETVKNFREKIKIAAIMNLFSDGLKEIVSFIKEKREKKNKKK